MGFGAQRELLLIAWGDVGVGGEEAYVGCSWLWVRTQTGCRVSRWVQGPEEKVGEKGANADAGNR